MVWDYQLLNLSTIDLDLVLDTPCYIFIHSCFILKVKGSAEIGSPYYRLWYIQDFLKTKRYSSNTTFKTAFTWLHRTFHKIWETKKAHFWARLDDAVFDSWSEWKGQKGWKAQCEHPSLHWKRELGCSFYLNCCLLLFFFGENMQDNMKTKFQQLLATLFPRHWKNMFFFCQTTLDFSVFLNIVFLVLIPWGLWWWHMHANIRVES